MNKTEQECKCGHLKMDHNGGGKEACYIDYNEDRCLKFEATQPKPQEDWDKELIEVLDNVTGLEDLTPLRDFIQHQINKALEKQREEIKKELERLDKKDWAVNLWGKDSLPKEIKQIFVLGKKSAFKDVLFILDSLKELGGEGK